MGEVNANFLDINEMHGVPNEVNHCSLVVLISGVEDTNSHILIWRKKKKKPIKHKNTGQMSRGLRWLTVLLA